MRSEDKMSEWSFYIIQLSTCKYFSRIIMEFVFTRGSDCFRIKGYSDVVFNL
jgi:hypothetical protein